MSRPSARVYIQIRETGEVFELADFMSIDTNLNMMSTSTASIQVVDNLDKWHTFFYQPDSQKPETGINELLLAVHQSPRFRYINQKLASLESQVQSLPDSTEKQNAISQLTLINERLVFDLMYRIWIDFRGRDDLYDLNPPEPSGNLPERWYAGFTGFITSIDESFSAGKLQSINLGCKDLRRLFEVTSVVTNKGYDPLWNDLASKLASMSAYTNNFSSFVDGAAVVYFVADLVNRIFHPGVDSQGNSQGLYGTGVFWSLPATQQNSDIVQSAQDAVQSAQSDVAAKSSQASSLSAQSAADPTNAVLSKQAANAKAQLVRAQSSLEYAQINLNDATTGVGKATVLRTLQTAGDITPLRDTNGFAGMTKSVGFFSEPQFKPPAVNGLTAKEYVKSDFVNYITQDAIDSLPGQANVDDYLQSRYEVDKMIASGNTDGISTNAYQIMVSSGVFGYENQRTPGSNVISMLANYMGYNIYFDAKGNLIYQTARYDDFPNAQVDGNGNEGDYDDPATNRGIPFVSTKYDSSGKVVGSYEMPGSESSSSLGLPFHGRNYIIGDESVLSWRVSQDEADATTALAIQSNPQLLTDVSAQLQQKTSTGLYTDPDLLRKFGPRYEMAPPIISSQLGTKDILNTLADGLLRRMNHNLENITMNLNCRPDLQMGRTFYFAQRRKLFYLTAIQEHYVQGDALDTTIQGQYGHLATDPIGDPIAIAINSNLYASVEEDYSIFNDLAEADAFTQPLDEQQ